ncbi:MAG: bifunctional precorrin-2 dehydrogenase/sirohydrochlorin ferrochelatase [Acidobacteria bacterium]|nr:bifunctional precorrin-2 dehydrogenase/sirohydrochlorin ferrochelatase [Acidobacteriota bacterium]
MTYPVTLRVEGRRCLVVGGGEVALEKVRALIAAGALVTVVAPEVVAPLGGLPGVTVVRRAYRAADLDGCRLVIAATGDPEVNGQVFADGEARGVWVNAVDDPRHCSFTMPAVVRQGPLSVAISTGGRSPAVASWLRRRLEHELDPAYAELLELLATEREALRSSGVSTEGLPWQGALEAGLLDLVREGRVEDARALLRETIREAIVERTAWQ